MKHQSVVNLICLCLVCILLEGCKGGMESRVLPSLRTEEHKSEKNNLYTKKVYRGQKLIYADMRMNGCATRLYCIDGEPIVSESDEDGDGFMERVTLMTSKPEKMEIFIRNKEGDIAPMKSSELQDLRGRIEEADKALKKAISP